MADQQRMQNEGEKRFLKRAMEAGNLEVHLFKNNVTIGNTMAAAAFTPPTFAGYAEKVILPADWQDPSTNGDDRGDIEATEKEWTYTGATEEDIYGYYIADPVDDVPLWVIKFETPRQVVGNGNFAVTPRLLAYDPVDA